MGRERGGWVYIMTNRYRGALYVGVTSSLADRIPKHRDGTGSDYCARRGLTMLVWAEHTEPIDLAIAYEKRLKRWHRDWKFALIEKANPEWDDLYEHLIEPINPALRRPGLDPGLVLFLQRCARSKHRPGSSPGRRRLVV